MNISDRLQEAIDEYMAAVNDAIEAEVSIAKAQAESEEFASVGLSSPDKDYLSRKLTIAIDRSIIASYKLEMRRVLLDVNTRLEVGQ